MTPTSTALVLATVLTLAALTGCSTPPPRSSPGAPAVLSRDAAERMALTADDARRRALAEAQPAGLAAVFRDRALRVLQEQVARMHDRGLRLEERDSVRRLVFWDSHAGEVVLQVEASQRLLSPSRSDALWAATVRQWWSRLAYAGGSWWIVDQSDLSPDMWRPDAAQP